jgi:dipeptidyl aminopeptidase/acylaminoacyl peptidase
VDAVIDEMVRAHQVDRERVHLLGSSMGAGSSLIYIMRRPKTIRSVVAVFPMTDFPRWLEEKPGYRSPVETAHGITDDTRTAALKELSPLLHPEAFRDVPVFLLHGDRDPIVSPHHSREFANALEEIGAKVVFREAAGEVHRDEIARPFQEELVEFISEADK